MKTIRRLYSKVYDHVQRLLAALAKQITLNANPPFETLRTQTDPPNQDPVVLVSGPNTTSSVTSNEVITHSELDLLTNQKWDRLLLDVLLFEVTVGGRDMYGSLRAYINSDPLIGDADLRHTHYANQWTIPYLLLLGDLNLVINQSRPPLHSREFVLRALKLDGETPDGYGLIERLLADTPVTPLIAREIQLLLQLIRKLATSPDRQINPLSQQMAEILLLVWETHLQREGFDDKLVIELGKLLNRAYPNRFSPEVRKILKQS